MIEDELTKIWKSSSNQERAKFEKSRLIVDLQSNLDRFHKYLKYGDRRPTITLLALIPLLGFYSYAVPFVLSKVASGLLILLSISAIVRVRRAQKQKPSALTETYLEYLYKTREYLNIRKKLVENSFYSFILPCIALILLFLAGFIDITAKRPIIILGVSTVVLGIVGYFLNKRIVKKSFLSRLGKLEKLIKVMEKEPS